MRFAYCLLALALLPAGASRATSIGSFIKREFSKAKRPLWKPKGKAIYDATPSLEITRGKGRIIKHSVSISRTIKVGSTGRDTDRLSVSLVLDGKPQELIATFQKIDLGFDYQLSGPLKLRGQTILLDEATSRLSLSARGDGASNRKSPLIWPSQRLDLVGKGMLDGASVELRFSSGNLIGTSK
jgi:hypothetical protein